MKQSQEQWVKDRLLYGGEVSRNSALENYISRLGAIIFNLKEDGWKIKGEWRKKEYGRDFIYVLIKSPFKKVIYTIPNMENKKITLWQKLTQENF